MTKSSESRVILLRAAHKHNLYSSRILTCKLDFSVSVYIKLLALTALLLCSRFPVFGLTFNGQQTVLSIQHRTCYGGSAVNFIANIYNDVPSAVCGTSYSVNNQTRFELRAGTSVSSPLVGTMYNGYSVVCHWTGNGVGISGGFDISNVANYPPGVYTLVGRIQMIGGSNSSLILTNTFTIGYETAWSDLLNMTASPSASSCRQSQVTANVPYGRALSSNYLSGNGTGWIESGAQFGAATGTRSVYALISSNSNTTTFVPNNSATYLEYRKGGTVTTTTGEGIYVKSGTVTYKLQGVSLTNRVRIERSSGSLKFYNVTNLTTPLTAINIATPTVPAAALSIPFTTGIRISAYASVLNDGLADVICSFTCVPVSTMYAGLSDRLDGTNYRATDKLCFYYDEAYDVNAATSLNYRIYNSLHTLVQGSTGTNVITVERVYGDNRYELNVASLSTGTYVLEVINDKKEVFYLRFTK